MSNLSNTTSLNLLQCCADKNPKRNIDYILNWIASAQVTLTVLNNRIEDILNDEIPPIVDNIIENYDWSSVEALAKEEDLIKDSYITIDGNRRDTYIYQINVADTNGIINAINSHNLKAGYKWYKVAYTFGSSVKYGLFSFTYVNSSDPTNSNLNIVVRFDGREVTINNVARDTSDVEIDLQNSTSTIVTTSSVTSESTIPITSGGVYTALQNISGSLISKTYETNSASVVTNASDDGGTVEIYVEKNDTQKEAIINSDNISNLNRILADPTPPTNSLGDGYSTNGQIYDAIEDAKKACKLADSRLSIGNTSITINRNTGEVSQLGESLNDFKMRFPNERLPYFVKLQLSNKSINNAVLIYHIESQQLVVKVLTSAYNIDITGNLSGPEDDKTITWSNALFSNQADVDTTVTSYSSNLITSGAVKEVINNVYERINTQSDYGKILSRLRELEKTDDVEYGIDLIYEFGGTKPRLLYDGNDIIYNYENGNIMIIYKVPYLYNLIFPGDTVVLKRHQTGSIIGTATVETVNDSYGGAFQISGISLNNTQSYDGEEFGLYITGRNYRI